MKLIVLLAVVLVAFAEENSTNENDNCSWNKCHPHSPSDSCPTEWYVQEWKYCAGIFGKQELCCPTVFQQEP